MRAGTTAVTLSHEDSEAATGCRARRGGAWDPGTDGTDSPVRARSRRRKSLLFCACYSLCWTPRQRREPGLCTGDPTLSQPAELDPAAFQSDGDSGAQGGMWGGGPRGGPSHLTMCHLQSGLERPWSPYMIQTIWHRVYTHVHSLPSGSEAVPDASGEKGEGKGLGSGPPTPHQPKQLHFHSVSTLSICT